MKLIKDNIELFIMYACVAVLCFVFACGDTTIVEPSPDPGPPPPPPVECEQEVEPNNSFADSDYLGVLPILSPETICGYLYVWPPYDTDFFFFYLSAPEFVEELHFSFAIHTELDITAKATLYQTIYDDIGNPTGDYQLIGQFTQGPGLLFVDEFAVPHDTLENNDLFVVVEAFGNPNTVAYYEMEYWNN
tara:strand:+ start:180 stop:749 length:570 start_codon:yes stop_codon:yes gene_type:complete